MGTPTAARIQLLCLSSTDTHWLSLAAGRHPLGQEATSSSGFPTMLVRDDPPACTLEITEGALVSVYILREGTTLPSSGSLELRNGDVVLVSSTELPPTRYVILFPSLQTTTAPSLPLSPSFPISSPLPLSSPSSPSIPPSPSSSPTLLPASRAAQLASELQLLPHPEGGYYRRVYQSDTQVLPQDGRGPRHSLTTIYFLLLHGQINRLHAVASDEAWHLYEGGSLQLTLLSHDLERLSRVTLTQRASPSSGPVHVVPSHTWQAASALGEYALVGCTVAPGFDFADFRMLSSEAALAQRAVERWPEVAGLV